ncbi:TOBE domain-containing protein [Methylorubrum thiocyanatum]|uniref:TOBE domain-containing protein n=1 Tax=Methylorubrum thiocyanatum TaxID=47958 RepID=UPI00398C4F5A
MRGASRASTGITPRKVSAARGGRAKKNRSSGLRDRAASRFSEERPRSKTPLRAVKSPYKRAYGLRRRTARLTRASARELGLTVGCPVFAIVKSEALDAGEASAEGRIEI